MAVSGPPLTSRTWVVCSSFRALAAAGDCLLPTEHVWVAAARSSVTEVSLRPEEGQCESRPSAASLPSRVSPQAGRSAAWTVSAAPPPGPQPSPHTRVLHTLHCQFIQLQLPDSSSSVSSSSDSSKVTQGGISGADLRQQCHPCPTGSSRPDASAPTRRGLPVLLQEALVLSLWLNAGHRCSHLR